MNQALNPQSNPVAFGSNARSPTTDNWFRRGSYARSFQSRPKTWLSIGCLKGAVIPASIHPYNLNRGSGGFGCSTTFFAMASLPSDAFIVAGLGDGAAACCACPEPGKDA